MTDAQRDAVEFLTDMGGVVIYTADDKPGEVTVRMPGVPLWRIPASIDVVNEAGQAKTLGYLTLGGGDS